ncbi:MAG: B12-binding domain-containing radical SAM protein [Bacillota bacterium]
MDKKVDLLLVNSLPLRQRTISDTSLENSLAIIRTYLEDRNYNIKVLDYQRINNLEKGIPKWCIALLRHITTMQINAYSNNNKIQAILLMILSFPFHSLSFFCKKLFIKGIIKEIVNTVKVNNVPFVGIKVWYGDAYKWSTCLSSELRKQCKETVVIAGGPQVKVYGEAVVEKKQFDLAVMGPGEEVLNQLLELRKKILKKQDFLKAVLSKNNHSAIIKHDAFLYDKANANKSSINAIIPKYNKNDLEGKIYLHTLVDGYGCPWNKCYFCTHTRYKAPYRPRDVKQIIDEIKSMSEMGISFFRLSSSDTPLTHGKKIAQAILDGNLQINYSMFTRPARVTRERFETYCLMIKSGLRAVFIGGETGHDLINNKIMNKGVCREDIIDTIISIKKAAKITGKSCRIGLSLIYPCPVTDNVSMQDVYEENISLVKSTIPDTVLVNPPGVFPGTRWFEKAESLGFKFKDSLVHDLMQYEYSIHKPVELWKKLDISLGDYELRKLASETGRLRREIASMGIPTDVSDEYLMMSGAIGLKTREQLQQFKTNTLIDTISGSTRYTEEIAREINHVSAKIAKHNIKNSSMAVSL